MLVSVIIPVYNVIDYLEDCWKSIVKQTYKNIEIILVDDGSTDGSDELCDKLVQTDSRACVIHRKNGGLSAARNSGLDVCRGNYITFVDSDDIVADNMIELMLKVLLSNDADIVHAKNIKWIDASEYLAIKDQQNTNITDEQVRLYKGEEYLLSQDYADMSWSKLYKKSCWQNVRFREGIIHEDFESTYKLIYEAARVAYIDEVLYFGRTRPGSIIQLGFRTESLVIIELCEERIHFFEKKSNLKLLQWAYGSYYEFLLSFVNRMGDCAGLSDIEKRKKRHELMKKYRDNIGSFVTIEDISLGVKIKLLACCFFPSLWG